MRDVKVLSVRAGPGGLGAALELVENGQEGFLVVDPGKEAGGWATSRMTEEGFTFDFGGHVLFPHKHYARFSELLDGLGLSWARSRPERGVQTEGRFLPYPAQRNLHRLPMRKLAAAVGSVKLHRRRIGNKPGDVEAMEGGDMGSYLHAHFGPYVTKLLMEPLNRKQWAHAPESLTNVWARHRSGSSTRNVADMNLKKTLRNWVSGKDDPGWQKDTRVAYPEKGGSGAIWASVAKAIPAGKMLLGVKVEAVSLENKTARLSNGETVRWERMVSTMPLDTLLTSIEGRPELHAQSKRFVKARSRLFGFGIKGEMPARYRGLHSCQVTDADVPFWRMNFPMTVSEGNGPEGCYSVLCEVSEPGGEPAMSDSVLRGKVEASLFRMGLIGKPGQKIISRWEYRIEHGYPVPFLERDALLAEVQPVLEAAEVYSRGRFGAWRYEISNQDHAFMQGVEVVRRILFRVPEETWGNAVQINEGAPASMAAPRTSMLKPVTAG